MSRNHRKKILVLRYRFIGDTILSVPFFRNLRRAEPEAHITWVMAPGSAEVVQGIPYVDEIIFWDPVTRHADSRGGHRTLSSKIAFIRELRANRYDKVYVLKRSFSSAIIALLSGAPERVGFDTEGRRFMLTKAVPYRPEQHEVLSFLDVLRADGVPVTDDYLEAWISPEEAVRGDGVLAGVGVKLGERVAFIHPFASNPPRGWHHDDFAALTHQLTAIGLKSVILGGRGDLVSWESWRHGCHDSTVSLIGATSLRETMAILTRGTIYIGNDSGIMHVAAAVGLPLVALFGPQSPHRFGPWGRNARVIYKAFPCSPCRQKFFRECDPSPRGKPACMESISGDEVIEEVIRISSRTDIAPRI